MLDRLHVRSVKMDRNFNIHTLWKTQKKSLRNDEAAKEETRLILTQIKQKNEYIFIDAERGDDRSSPFPNAEQYLDQTQHGRYHVKAAYGMPSYFDKVLLNALLYELLKADKKKESVISMTRYELAKIMYPGKKDLDTPHFNRVLLSLKRWFGVSMDFHGIFYKNGHRISQSFTIISTVTLDHDTKKLTIRFNEDFLEQQRLTNYFQYYSIDTFRRIDQPIAARLYELLSGTFQAKSLWRVSLQRLAKKLTISRRKNAKKYYPSDVLPLLKKAVNRYNQHAEKKVIFVYDKQQSLCTFKRVITRSVHHKEIRIIPAKKLSKSDEKIKITQGKSNMQELSEHERKRLEKEFETSIKLFGLPKDTSRKDLWTLFVATKKMNEQET